MSVVERKIVVSRELAIRFWTDPIATYEFVEAHGDVPFKEIMAIRNQAMSTVDWDEVDREREAAIAAAKDLQVSRAGRRHDADELLAFVERNPHLPLRWRQAAELCILRGMSLAEAGEQLGVGRETVRTHLRRLRARLRLVRRRAGPCTARRAP